MCKYEMDPACIVKITERTRFCPQADGQTDGRRKTSIPPLQLRWSGGMKMSQTLNSQKPHSTEPQQNVYKDISTVPCSFDYKYIKGDWCPLLGLLSWCPIFNTLRPRQNGCRFADNIFKRLFLNENIRISIKFSLKFVPKGPINNNPALVQIMAWRRSGDKPLSEPMMVSLLTHIYVTRPQWVKSSHCNSFEDQSPVHEIYGLQPS